MKELGCAWLANNPTIVNIFSVPADIVPKPSISKLKLLFPNKCNDISGIPTKGSPERGLLYTEMDCTRSFNIPAAKCSSFWQRIKTLTKVHQNQQPRIPALALRLFDGSLVPVLSPIAVGWPSFVRDRPRDRPRDQH